MSKRASLPGAEELFRSTVGPAPLAVPSSVSSEPSDHDGPSSEASAANVPQSAATAPRSRRSTAPSGRTKHDQKITVYLTGDELLELEHTRLQLRADFDIGVDRGRIVREALALLFADLTENGPDSAIVRRLT